MPIPIEDEYVDVIRKAAVGLRLSDAALSLRSGLSLKELRALLAGESDVRNLRRISAVLQLDADALVSLALQQWTPEPVSVAGLHCINMPFPEASYPDASVNVFVVVKPNSKEAIVFDSGTEAKPILELLEQNDLNLHALFLTHTHRDHVGGYAELLDATGCQQVYAPIDEPYADAILLKHGEQLDVAGLRIEARLTNGHSRGGMSYLVSGLDQSVIVAGDALMAGSVGGAKNAYFLALKNIRDHILSLPSDTIVCPGHGPMTTVGEEREHNPFFVK
ncbi:MAG: MBL fold metallo-hydrolase [Opitutaceae bacterium]